MNPSMFMKVLKFEVNTLRDKINILEGLIQLRVYKMFCYEIEIYKTE